MTGPIDANTIQISGSVPLANLDPLGGSNYHLIVKIFKPDGTMLVNPGIPNPYTATVHMTDDDFIIEMPITEALYNYTGLTFRVYANDDDDCCQGAKVADINNSVDGGTLCDRGPTIFGDFTATPSAITFLMDGENVFVIGYEIKNSVGVTVRSGVINMQDGSGNDIFVPGNRPIIPISPVLTDGDYTLVIQGASCVSVAPSSRAFTISSGGSGDMLAAKGSYEVTVGNRVWSYAPTGKFVPIFKVDGTISDGTPGLHTGLSPNEIDGVRVFYMMGYSPFKTTNLDGSYFYKSFQNVFLKDGAYRLGQAITNGATSLNDFISKLPGYPPGVDNTNTLYSEFFFSVKTIGAPDNDLSILKVSRTQLYYNFPLYATPDGSFGIYQFNRDKTRTFHQAYGINTETEQGASIPQPYTWKIWKYYENYTHPTSTELYNYGKSLIVDNQLTDKSIFMDEVPENIGDDGYIYPLMHHFYRGALDGLRIANPSLGVRQSGLYGPYGGDSYQGLFSGESFGGSKATYIDALTLPRVHQTLLPGGGGWNGGPVGYYANGDINYRNVNLNSYFSIGYNQTPYFLIYANDRIKIGTKTFGGVDRERNWMPVTMPLVQNLNTGGIEWNNSGEITKFSTGDIKSLFGNSVPWEEMYVLAFYSRLICSGLGIWGAHFNGLGINETQLSPEINNMNVRWDQGGDGSYTTYTPGVDGAPALNYNGLLAQAFASPVDAGYAGWKKATLIKSRCVRMYHASYNSSKGSLAAVPGDNGLILNGFGPLNIGCYVNKDALDGKKGLALVGENLAGTLGVSIYYNGFLSVQETETSVNVIHNGQAISHGTVYGREISVVLFDIDI